MCKFLDEISKDINDVIKNPTKILNCFDAIDSLCNPFSDSKDSKKNEKDNDSFSSFLDDN